ncbi:MAG: flagellar basal body P-ring formation chaperone FlgA [Pseudomonadota bacterium]
MTWQPLDTIVEAATGAVIDAFQGQTDDYDVEVREPDSRLRLKQCAAPLKAELLSQIRGQQRISIQVRCDDSPGWKIYVQAQVRQYTDVVVVNRSLPRGHVLQSTDLEKRRQSLSGLAGGFVDDVALLVGRKLLRTVSTGSVLRPNDVRAMPAIKRGQILSIVAKDASIHIKMSGTAMSDGVVGQRIMVKNLSSGRIIEGVVRDQTTVEVP